jgi:protein-S-isoprenylcysteine O-methyltransferase Ste14
MDRSQQLMVPAAWFFYLLIVFEFLFMITPFALYFYSAYTPALNLLNSSVYTAWLTGFFLPHFCHTRSNLLATLNTLGWVFAYSGLLLFFVSALQLYGSKLMGRGTVTGLLYRYIRHPQYLALGILGLGTTLIWPRFIVLITYVTMLFLYRVLAQIEEQHCLTKFAASYEEYQKKTGMFLPRLKRQDEAASSSYTRSRSVWISLGWYAGSVIVAVMVGLVLREHTLTSVSAVYHDREAIVSPALLSDDELLQAYGIAAADPIVKERSRTAIEPLLIYVVPVDWYLPDLPLDDHEIVRKRGGHGTPSSFDHGRFRVLVSSIRTHADQAGGRDILRQAYAYDPLILVEVDIESGEIVGQSEPPANVIWGDISSPLI